MGSGWPSGNAPKLYPRVGVQTHRNGVEKLTDTQLRGGMNI